MIGLESHCLSRSHDSIRINIAIHLNPYETYISLRSCVAHASLPGVPTRIGALAEIGVDGISQQVVRLYSFLASSLSTLSNLQNSPFTEEKAASLTVLRTELRVHDADSIRKL